MDIREITPVELSLALMLSEFTRLSHTRYIPIGCSYTTTLKEFERKKLAKKLVESFYVLTLKGRRKYKKEVIKLPKYEDLKSKFTEIDDFISKL